MGRQLGKNDKDNHGQAYSRYSDVHRAGSTGRFFRCLAIRQFAITFKCAGTNYRLNRHAQASSDNTIRNSTDRKSIYYNFAAIVAMQAKASYRKNICTRLQCRYTTFEPCRLLGTAAKNCSTKVQLRSPVTGNAQNTKALCPCIQAIIAPDTGRCRSSLGLYWVRSR